MTLRSDNADLRLTAKGLSVFPVLSIPMLSLIPPSPYLLLARALGAVSDTRWASFSRTKLSMDLATSFMQAYTLSPQGWWARGFNEVGRDGVMRR